MAPVTVSAIVVSYRRPDILDACLTSLREALARTGAPTELIVVDNASRDGSLELVGAARAGGDGGRDALERRLRRRG